ncbi:surfeit locus protein 1-like [Nicotiana tabacum]|uniref:SURF1-like protein n=1 Tax=Nicotiana tabacum TaxID=4097 RepID=A0A1S3Y3X5_TOBAC|nr:surfeit locus protein 1 [Nicotiana tomentosiformis]XP_016446860.1 PREDICTED: surfeit locus protein 1-like [Nicotiana tabacum]
MAASISKALTRNLLRRSGDTTRELQLRFCSAATSAAAISAPETQPSEKNGPSRLSKLLLFVPGVITFGLGTWQIIRRQEKIEMLEYRQNRLRMDPLNCNEVSPSSENVDALEFRRVLCSGVFDEKRSIFIGPRSRSISGVTENGYYVITPLLPLENDPKSVQSPILVNRGWVPRNWRDKSLEVAGADDQPSSIAPPSQESAKSSWWMFGSKKKKVEEDQVPTVKPTEVIGVVRGSEKPSIFVPANDPSSFQWFYVDVPAIARACGLPENTLYIEDINDNVDPSNPYPLPKDTNTLVRSSVMPQQHLNYTLTWYSLSAAVTFMAFKRLKSKKSRR